MLMLNASHVLWAAGKLCLKKNKALLSSTSELAQMLRFPFQTRGGSLWLGSVSPRARGHTYGVPGQDTTTSVRWLCGIFSCAEKFWQYLCPWRPEQVLGGAGVGGDAGCTETLSFGAGDAPGGSFPNPGTVPSYQLRGAFHLCCL